MEEPFDTLAGRKLTWSKLVGRQALLIAVVLTVLAASGSAQWHDIELGSPLSVSQQSPVYLRSLTSGREEGRENNENLEAEVRLDDTINRVGRAFRTGDADALESCLVTGKRKIYLSLETHDSRQGHYGPGQALHILDRLFRDVETREFLYDSRQTEHFGEGAVFRADWSYLVLETDELVTERLHFKLEQDGKDWRINEIRGATR